jgi:hypothetical protein
MPAKVSIDLVANESDLIAAAKNAQKEMDTLAKKLKEAGVSGAAFNKAMADAKKRHEDATGAAKQQRLSLTDLKSGIDLATQALQTMKQGYDFAREGASLEFQAIKFDRLAATINTTGDALLGKLKEATRGTMSDFEAMASATDLVSLGLVKSEADVVRLSTVVSGLGMDMNQLVLALSNQTTMRFDQLGVAVVGFEDKVKSLEATGMSAQDAFTEAFLRQAEEQLLKVGNAADTSLGTFLQLEAQTKNLKDEMKMLAADALLPVVRGMNMILDETKQVEVAQRALNEAEEEHRIIIAGNAEQARILRRAHVEAMLEARAETENAKDSMEGLGAATAAVNEELALTPEQLKAISEENKNFLGVLGQSGEAITTYRDGLAAANAELAAGKITTEEHSAKVQQLSADYKQASADIVMSIVEMKLAQDGWTDAELNAYLQIGKQQGKFTQDQIDMANGAVEMADRIIAGVETMDGPFTHVGERAEDNAFAFGEMTGAAGGLVDSLYDVSGGAANATSALNSIPTTINVDIYVRMHGRIPTNLGGSAGHEQNDNLNNAPLQGGYQQGGEVFAGVPVGVNEAGREVFMSQQNGRILGHAESLHALSLGGGGGSKYGPFYGPVTIQMSDDSATGFMGLR